MTTTNGEPASAFEDLLATLHRSHDRLVGVLDPLGPDQVEQQSYDDEWSIAQVASHLGSGAEIFQLFVEAALTGTATPGIERLQPIWDVWNAKAPAVQAADALRADAGLLSRFDGLTAEDHARWHLEIFGGSQTPADLLRLRLSEHAVHTWDIAVALDPTATVAEDAVAWILDSLPWLVERAGKGTSEPVSVAVTTTDPARRLLLTVTRDDVTLVPAGAADVANPNVGAKDSMPGLTLPGEAFVRLVYGRLDPDHTPDAVRPDGIDLDTLRRSFPGI